MSTNNQLVILKKNGKFEVHENPCVDNDFKPNKDSLLYQGRYLRNAVIYAKKYCKEWPCVEYGYVIDDNCLGDIKGE